MFFNVDATWNGFFYCHEQWYRKTISGSELTMYNVVELYDRRRQNRATVELVPVHASAQNVYANWIELLRYIKINVFSCISYYLVTLAGSVLLLKNKIQYSSLGVFSKTTKYKTAELNAYELNSDSFHKSYLNKKK